MSTSTSTTGTSRGLASFRGAVTVARNEARLLRHDPVPAVVLVVMPIVLMALLTPALALALASEGYPDASGAEQSVPGMVCVFSFFAVALVGFSLFREHGWRTWTRLRAAGLSSGSLIAGKLVIPAALLAAQHVVLFATGIIGFDLTSRGPWLGVVLTSAAFSILVLSMGLAAAAVFDTIQQVNAVTNLGAMILGGLGGGFVPVDTLPEWIQPLAPLSPAYWAMEAYRTVLLDGGGPADIAGPIGVLLALTAAFVLIAAWRLRLDQPKRTWG